MSYDNGGTKWYVLMNSVYRYDFVSLNNKTGVVVLGLGYDG